MRTSGIIFGLALVGLLGLSSAKAQMGLNTEGGTGGGNAAALAPKNSVKRSSNDDISQSKSVSTEGITTKESIGDGINLYLSNFQILKDEIGVEYCTFDTNIKNETKNQIENIDAVIKWSTKDKADPTYGDTYTITYTLDALPAGKEVSKKHDPVYLWCPALSQTVPSVEVFSCKMLGLEKKVEKNSSGAERNTYMPKSEECKSIIKFKKQDEKQKTFDDLYKDAVNSLNSNKSF